MPTRDKPATAAKPTAPAVSAGKASSSDVKAGLGAVKDLTLSILQDKSVPPWLKGLCWAAGVGEIVMLILAVVFLSAGHAVLGFSLAIAGFVLLLVAMFFLRDITKSGMQAVQSQATAPPPAAATTGPAPAPVAPMWTRVVPRIPMPQDILLEVRRRLEDIRRIVGEELNVRFPGVVKREWIRANIFLVDTGAVSTEGICELFIPKKLHSGMEPDPASDPDAAERDRADRERNIRFKPGQGSTGVAFLNSDTESARATRLGEESYVWAEKYSLTDAQKRAIHPDLKWVISFPLPFNDGDGRGPQALGVLNVDGLVHEVDDDLLKVLIGRLSVNVAAISGLLVGASKCRMSLLVEDIT